MVKKIVHYCMSILLLVTAEARRLDSSGWWKDTEPTGECQGAMEAVQSRIKEAMWELPLKGVTVEENLISAPFRVKIHNIALHGNPQFEANNCRYTEGDELEMDFVFHNIRVKGLVTLYDRHLPQQSAFQSLDPTPAPKYYGFIALTIRNAPLALFMSRDYRYSSKMYVFRDAQVRLKDGNVGSFDGKEHRSITLDASLVDREIEGLLMNAVRPILEREIQKVIWKEMKDAVIMPMKRYEMSQGKLPLH